MSVAAKAEIGSRCSAALSIINRRCTDEKNGPPTNLDLGVHALAFFQSGVDAVFELTVKPQRRAIGKRQHLRHEDGGDLPAGIDPIIRIEEAAPSQAAGAAAAGHGLHGDHVAKTPFARDAGT